MFDKTIHEQEDVLYIYSKELGFARIVGPGWAEDTTDENVIEKILRLGVNALEYLSDKPAIAPAPVYQEKTEFPKYTQSTFDWGM